MKIAIITDTHFGARNDNTAFADHFDKFYDEVFFPYLEQNNIKTVLHLGDLLDRRKYVNFRTAQQARRFITKLQSSEIHTHLILGNHDTYYKNTNELNGVVELFGSESDYLKVYVNDPVELTFDSLKVLMVPWITQANSETCFKRINETDAQFLMGHLEIAGFEMMRGHLCDHGHDRKLFKKFDAVYSGHFHHPSEYENIKYLGAPYEMNWTDYNGKRGFHILDTETRELEFIENPFRMFEKIFYDDKDMSVEEVSDMDVSGFTNTYIKVIIQNKENPYIFDLFVDKLQQIGPADIKIVEDHMNLDELGEEELIDEAQDTHTILTQYIEGLETKVDKTHIKNFVTQLYNEAVNI